MRLAAKLIAAAFALSTLAFYVFARYRYPLVPLLMLAAAPGLLALPRRCADRCRTGDPRPAWRAAAQDGGDARL